ncbi:hypothetical protein DFA_01289 [Cavenderia fasciculata]|uniref:RecQ-mediated genome instability protein 1 n=1 Tax=Cavenderia fasciculata TaxID=261658 RepID=F4PRW9_CACFS|nr:uncharacterized protein DFA_01289 [Cavenderia fasciculata]EGG21405.1 hypothetical protein DFA_01289 [Cavenderia fasciculata]|eukprot:XP_004359255.1 hypothetical protein DFA_01289 [Cavenderia fasciculata]
MDTSIIQEWNHILRSTYSICIADGWFEKCVNHILKNHSRYSSNTRLLTDQTSLKREKDGVLEEVYKCVLLSDIHDFADQSNLFINDATSTRWNDHTTKVQQMTGGPYFMQINQTKNISEPFETRFDHDASSMRTLSFQLSDGKHTFKAIEHTFISFISPQLAPGTKVLLKDVPIRRGLLLLDNNNIRLLGGSVDKLSNSNIIDKQIIQNQINNNNQNNNNNNNNNQTATNNNINNNNRSKNQPITINYQNDNDHYEYDANDFMDMGDDQPMDNDNDDVFGLNQRPPPTPSRPITKAPTISLSISKKTATTTNKSPPLLSSSSSKEKEYQYCYISTFLDQQLRGGQTSTKYLKTLGIITGCTKDKDDILVTISDGTGLLQVILSNNVIKLLTNNQKEDLSNVLQKTEGIFSITMPSLTNTFGTLDNVNEPDETFISFLENELIG